MIRAGVKIWGEAMQPQRSETWQAAASHNGARVGLVCHDNHSLNSMGRRLREAGFDIASFSDGNAALAEFGAHPPETAIVDLSLSRPAGTEVLRRMRSRWNFPIIALAERGDEVEEVFSFRLGADHYVSASVSGRALAERIRAGLRRQALSSPQIEETHAQDTLNSGKLVIDEARHTVCWSGAQVALTQTEFQVLLALAARPGFVKSREQLMDVAYTDGDDVVDRTIDSHIKRLRKKIRRVDPQFAAIRTIYGVGYKYVPCTEA